MPTRRTNECHPQRCEDYFHFSYTLLCLLKCCCIKRCRWWSFPSTASFSRRLNRGGASWLMGNSTGASPFNCLIFVRIISSLVSASKYFSRYCIGCPSPRSLWEREVNRNDVGSRWAVWDSGRTSSTASRSWCWTCSTDVTCVANISSSRVNRSPSVCFIVSLTWSLISIIACKMLCWFDCNWVNWSKRVCHPCSDWSDCWSSLE